jgi:hypothetical protein
MLLSYSCFGRLPRWEPAGTSGPEAEFAARIGQELAPPSRIAWPPRGFASERWRAQLPSNLSWKDGGEALFDREFALRWLSESRELCACEPNGSVRPGGAESERRPVDLRERLHVSWSDRSAQSLLRSAQKLGASHVVLRADSLLGAPDPQEEGAPVLPEPLFALGSWALVPVRTAP